MVALAQAMGYVCNLWASGIGTVDNFSKARIILGLADRDVQTMVLRRDLAAFVDNNGKPACAFYTNAQGSPGADTRAISLVQYLLNASSSTSVLQRLNYGINFPPTSGTTPPALTLTIGNTTSLPQLANITSAAQSDTLATGVLLFETQFVDGTGKILTTDGPSPNLTSFSFNFASPSVATNPRSVVISVLVLNNSAYNLASQNGTLSSITNLFAPANLQATQTYSQYWNKILSSGVTWGNQPEQVRHGIQVFERHIPLPNTTRTP